MFNRRKKKVFIIYTISCLVCMLLTLTALSFVNSKTVYAADEDGTSSITVGIDGDKDNDSQLSISFASGDGSDLASVLQMVLVLTVLSLAPSILIMVTSFTRIIIVLHFVRTAIGTNTAPPNQVLVGLSLFLTLFIMLPVFSKVNTEALSPLSKNEITYEQAYEKAVVPLKEFMLKQTRDKDLRTFIDIAQIDVTDIDDVMEDIPMTVVIPSFIISELRIAFIIGFLIYIPFIVIDMVVSSTLMSMGMMMLPPTTISLPFKILLFVLADGWNLIISSLVTSFY